MEMELKNMYLLEEENTELKEDLLRLKVLSSDDKHKEIVSENERLRLRNGEL